MPNTYNDIQKNITDQLHGDSRIDASNIRINVSNETVVLSGTVPSYRARMAAEEDVRMVTTNSNIDNRITRSGFNEITISIVFF